MLIFEEILFVFFVAFGALAYGIAASRQKAFVERAKEAGAEHSEEHKKALEEFEKAKRKIAGWFWLMAAITLMGIIGRLISTR